ncbi:unnamed protein product [Clavelina lepadiformis]|uniref:Uncharacterized protein n=1 Tax=Clavelina lepadiformis TaxID=159417 RepID=A0ABP0F9S2_CLALP
MKTLSYKSIYFPKSKQLNRGQASPPFHEQPLNVVDSTVVSNASVVADKESQGSKYDERQRLEKKTAFGPKIGVLYFHNNPL